MEDLIRPSGPKERETFFFFFFPAPGNEFLDPQPQVSDQREVRMGLKLLSKCPKLESQGQRPLP